MPGSDHSSSISSGGGSSSTSSSADDDTAFRKKRKADALAVSDGEQQQQQQQQQQQPSKPEPPPTLYGVAQRRQPAGEGQPSIPYDCPPLNKHGVAQVESFISKWVERDPDATELMQLHNMEAARSQHHLKQIRKSLEEQMNHTKDILKLVFDDRMDKIDPATLAHLRDDSAMWLPRPEVPVCGEDGCKRPMHFCETARGDDDYENGCWECDKCDAEFDPSHGDAGCERWNCADCEYDMCQACAGVTRAHFEAWDARVELLSSLEDLPKRWWVNARSDPTRRADPAVTRKRRRTGATGGAGGRKKPGAGARQIGAGASIGSTGSWAVSAAAAAVAFAPSCGASSARPTSAAGAAAAATNRAAALPGAINMGPAIVGKAIEVQWGRKAEWFAGFVTEFTDGQHHVKYNNGENEWVSLYRDFDNGVEWQMLPQRSLLPDGEHGTSAPGAKRHDLGDYEMLDGDDDEYADASRAAYSSSSPAQQEREIQQARQYTGVHAMNGMFHASVRLWDRDVSLGFFDTALEAAVAHDQGMRTFYGPKKQVPLNFTDGMKGAVERRVAALIAEKKHAGGSHGVVAVAKKGGHQLAETEGAASAALRRVMNIPDDVAVTMMGARVSDGDAQEESAPGRSRHSLCA